MPKERLYLFDTTLRDGAQTNGVDFTLADKLAIASMLDELGIDYVEGGYPGANPTDSELFGKDRKLATTFTAFGMTRRPGRSASNDPGLAALLEAKADAICFVAKSWDYHVKVALETTAANAAALPPTFGNAMRDGVAVMVKITPDRFATIRRAALATLLRKFKGPGAYEGLWELLARTYRALADGSALPVTASDILEVNRMVEALKPGEQRP